MTTPAYRLARSSACVAMMIAALTLPPPAWANEPETGSTQPDGAIEIAPVIVDGRTVFLMRGIASLPAHKRAGLTAAKIEAVALDRSVAVSELRVVETEFRSNVLAGDVLIVSALDFDAEAEQADNRQVLAEFMRNRIAAAIELYRHERSAEYLRRQAIQVAVMLGALVASLLALRWLFRRIGQALDRRFLSVLKDMEAKSFNLLSADELRHVWLGGLRSIRLLLVIVLVFGYLDYSLSLFPWTRKFALAVAALFIEPLNTMWSGFASSLSGLVFLGILFFVTRYILRLAQLLFSGIAYGTIRPEGFEQEWAWPTYRLVRVLVIAFALVIAYPYIPGSDSAAFKGLSLFLGLLMSLGATSMVSNLLAGYMLIYRRAFRTGDRIKVGDIVGEVVQMRQQLTHLRTPKNEEVTIPSSVMLNSNILNYSAQALEGKLILHTTVGIGYETPWRQVEAMLLEAAGRTEALLREPPPFVLQTSLGDFCVTYEINAYCDRPGEMPRIYTALHRNILDLFNEHGVQIMTPSYEGDPDQPKIVPKEQWYAAPAKPSSEK